MTEYQCLWFQFFRASSFYCMAIAAELPLPTGPPLAADWVAACIAAISETSITATAVVASAVITVCHASAESLSPSGRRTIQTRGTRGARQEAAPRQESRQEVEALVNRRRWHEERRCDNQPNERHERVYWQRKLQQLQLCNNQQKKEMGQRRDCHLTRRWWRDGSPGGVGSAIVGEAAVTTTTQR